MLIQMNPNLRIVVIESPYDTLSDPLARDLFSKMLQLKIAGYRMVYPYGVLPADTSDFIATHQLICREVKDSYEVLMGVKYITLKKSQTHNLPFPGLTLLRAARAELHEKALEQLLVSYRETPEKVSYGGSWAIGAEARSNPVLQKVLKDLFAVTLVRHEMEIGTSERFCAGATKVKTHEYFQNLGYEKFCYDGQVLPTINTASLLGEPAFMFRCTRFSPAALDLADRYQKLWDSRLVISSESIQSTPAKKEAA
jgi:hypothetical protein